MTLHRAAACSHHRAGALPSGAHAAARNSHFARPLLEKLAQQPWRLEVVLLIAEHVIGG